MSTRGSVDDRSRRADLERQEKEMWAGVAEYFACDGTCEWCTKFLTKKERRERDALQKEAEEEGRQQVIDRAKK